MCPPLVVPSAALRRRGIFTSAMSQACAHQPDVLSFLFLCLSHDNPYSWVVLNWVRGFHTKRALMLTLKQEVCSPLCGGEGLESRKVREYGTGWLRYSSRKPGHRVTQDQHLCDLYVAWEACSEFKAVEEKWKREEILTRHFKRLKVNVRPSGRLNTVTFRAHQQ